ncbi:hypothetical protein ACQUFY_26100 (plasmid) [Robbsia andropogonis]|uniref:hypothetical protein n=1 Tax=Robbsia andropogonis TaxID=28092 RepID=UPI003D237762
MSDALSGPELLEAAFRDALDIIAANNVTAAEIELTFINADALTIVEEAWMDSPSRPVDWDWRRVVEHFRRRARRQPFEAAIWADGILCGLAIGQRSRRGTRVYIEGVEGSPLPHPLKKRLLVVSLLVAEAYARRIGAKEVWIREPDPTLIPFYEVLGYTESMRRAFFMRRLRFCIKTIDYTSGVLP